MDIEYLIRRRKMALQNFCFHRRKEVEAKTIASRLLVDEKHRLLYCTIAKVGSTSIKEALIRSSGTSLRRRIGEKYVGVHSPVRMAKHKLTTLNNYNKANQEQRLQKYWKFIVVRHPFDRLVSAYNDKMLIQTEYNPWLKLYAVYKFRLGRLLKSMTYFRRLCPNGTFFSSELHLKNRTHLTATKSSYRCQNWDPEDVNLLEILRQTPVTFKEFVSLVLEYHSDNHWRSMFESCEPCSINYDFVGHIETFSVDYAPILKRLNASADAMSRSHIRRKTSWWRLVGSGLSKNRCLHLQRRLTEFTSVDNTQLERLQSMYGQDFAAFDYWWDNATLTAHVCA